MSVEVEESKANVSAMRRAESVERSSALFRVVRDVRLLLIALWLGGAVFFSAAVAPIAFSVLRSRNVVYANEVAGPKRAHTLPKKKKGGVNYRLLAFFDGCSFFI